MEYRLRTIWNAIATIQARSKPIAGSCSATTAARGSTARSTGQRHGRDAEMCRARSGREHGWKPRRTLVYASWDAEEYGLVGSTEWAEEHAEELRNKAVLLLNVDSAVSGKSWDSGSPLAPRLRAGSVGSDHRRPIGPFPPRPVDRRTTQGMGQQCPLVLTDPIWDSNVTNGPAARNEAPRSPGIRPQMSWLGSGSDYTAFLDHLGVPAVDAGFKGDMASILDLRQFQLDGEIRRSRVLESRHVGPSLYADRDAGAAPTSFHSDSSPTVWLCASMSTNFA
jgi:N-acetylated-alpha-linked acidic dipeptidase